MKPAIKNLLEHPVDLQESPVELQEVLLKMQKDLIDSKERKTVLSKKCDWQENYIETLQEENALLRRQLFGSKSERYAPPIPPEQLTLFSEEAINTVDVDDDTDIVAEEETEVAAHTRKKKSNQAIPDSLPRVQVEHEPSETDRICTCGKCRPRCGSEVTKRLRYIPQELLVEEHIYWKYGECKCNHPDKDTLKGVVTAPREAIILPGSIATPSLLAHIFVSKFADSLPYYRQSKRFERDKIFISRQNMCNWTIKVSVQLQGLMELLHQYTLSGPLVNIDETPLQVLKEPGRSPTSKSYAWVLYGGPPDKKAVYFKYAPSRARKIAKELLGDYSGCVQSDDYSAYIYLNSEQAIIHITCMAHVRRKFMDLQKALKVLPTKGKKAQKKANNTDKILRLIQKLYKLEKKYKKEHYADEDLLLKRQKEAKPVFEELKEKVSGLIPKVPPKSTLGNALLYAQKNLPLIEQYLELPYVSLDNNDVENKLRLFVQGRKNWLFSYNAAGANATTTFYSLIQTAKINGLNPYHYLKFLFQKLPLIDRADQLKGLLPMDLTPEQISE